MHFLSILQKIQRVVILAWIDTETSKPSKPLDKSVKWDRKLDGP